MSNPYSNDTTSRTAALSLNEGKAAQDRRQIVELAARMGSWGVTDEMIARACPQILPNASRARRIDCLHEKRQWLAYTGVVGTSPTSGLRIKVYHVTDRGLEHIGWPAGSWCVKVSP